MPIDKDVRKYIIINHNKEIPDIYKYQLNGKTGQENYIDLLENRKKAHKKIMEEKEIEKELEKQIEKKLSVLLEQKLEELLKGF